MKKLITICTVVELTVLATSVTYALPSDNFNDNSMDTSLWNLYEEEHSNAWLDETNQRLEMRSTGAAGDFTSVYVSNGWGLSTINNFSLKIDFHCGSTSGPYYSGFDTLFGFGKGVNDLEIIKNNNVDICASLHFYDCAYPCFYYDVTTDGNEVYGNKARTINDGTLYISYDATVDELYLSDTGYDTPWITISGLLQGEWGAAVVSPFLGGWVDNRTLDSSEAYLDNFVIDSGTVFPGTVIPAPGALLLGSIGAGLVGRLHRRRIM